MENPLITNGIILHSGDIGKDKINLISGAMTQPFAAILCIASSCFTRNG